jgi:hypothetical protein
MEKPLALALAGSIVQKGALIELVGLAVRRRQPVKRWNGQEGEFEVV